MKPMICECCWIALSRRSARFGTPGAVKAAVTHGLKRQPLLGDTMARLTDLGSQDLSSEPATVEFS